ncbi:MAG: GNAT family N-acetyltransferase [Piscinibacter sp.]|nr:GNAT family N-acetyltransferase [Piscinibacter sp.]
MTAASIVLRLARPDDAEALAALSRDLIETGLPWRYRPERMARLIGSPEVSVLVAASARRIAGFAVMEFGDERAHLMLLAVRPALQRRGLGRRLVAWLLESAQVAGMASVHLELRAANEGARAFYATLDFVPTLQVPGYYDGREGALRMLRLLRVPHATGP